VTSSLRKNLQQDGTFRLDTSNEGDIIVTPHQDTNNITHVTPVRLIWLASAVLCRAWRLKAASLILFALDQALRHGTFDRKQMETPTRSARMTEWAISMPLAPFARH